MRSTTTHPSPARGLDPSVLRRLSDCNSPRPLLALAFDWSVALAAVLACAWTGAPAVWIAAWLAIGWAQHGIAILGHDAVHGLLAPSRRWSERLGRWLCWGPLAVSFEGYRRLHLGHHRLVGTPDDPEPPAMPARIYRRRFTASSPWRAAFTALIGDAIGELLLFQRHARPRGWRELASAIMVPAGGWTVAWAAGALWIPALWTVSTMTSFFLFSRLRSFGEHLGAPELRGEHTHRMIPPRWLRWASHPHNIDHHWEHHRWPSVPYHRLPTLRRAVAGPPVRGLLQVWRERADAERERVECAIPALAGTRS